MIDVFIIVALIVGCALGFGWREELELSRRLKSLQGKDSIKSGVTQGAYSVPKSMSGHSKSVATPKTPQQLEWERQQREMEQTLIERGTHPYGNN